MDNEILCVPLKSLMIKGALIGCFASTITINWKETSTFFDQKSSYILKHEGVLLVTLNEWICLILFFMFISTLFG